MIPIFLRRKRDLGGPIYCELPSATDGAYFSAQISGSWRQGSAFHADRLALLRADVVSIAREIARTWHADEREECENAINAKLGAPQRCPNGFYVDRWARVVLDIDGKSISIARQRKEDHGRIERLKWIADLLYSDPKLLMVDYFERHPDRQIEDKDIDRFRRFAAQIKGFEDWWSPIMQAWIEISASTKTTAPSSLSLDILRDVIMALDSRLSKDEIGSSGLTQYLKSD